MKKKMFLPLIVILLLSITGCEKGQDLSYQSKGDEVVAKEDNYLDNEDTTTSKDGSNNRFKVVSFEKNENGSIGVEYIRILVDTETKVMYMLMNHDTMTIMVDEDGKPLIYSE